jgi:hypothetical protein
MARKRRDDDVDVDDDIAARGRKSCPENGEASGTVQKAWNEMLALCKADRVRAKQRKAARMATCGAAFGRAPIKLRHLAFEPAVRLGESCRLYGAAYSSLTCPAPFLVVGRFYRAPAALVPPRLK